MVRDGVMLQRGMGVSPVHLPLCGGRSGGTPKPRTKRYRDDACLPPLSLLGKNSSVSGAGLPPSRFASRLIASSYFGSLYAFAARRRTVAVSFIFGGLICWYSHSFSPVAYGSSQSIALRRLRPSAVW